MYHPNTIRSVSSTIKQMKTMPPPRQSRPTTTRPDTVHNPTNRREKRSIA
jgi:hypothetical protein